MTTTSRPPASYTEAEAKQVFFEDTEHILANLRYILELPLLTYEQRKQVKDIMGSLFALRRQLGEE
jgi:hypothetical protein